jgi:hypothetical protein
LVHWFFSYCGDSSWAQWEKAGVSIRLGRHLFAVHREDYRDRRPGWPKWIRFNLARREGNADDPTVLWLPLIAVVFALILLPA